MRIDMVGSETPSPIMSGRRAGLQWRGLTALLALSCIAAVIVATVTIRLALAQTGEGQWAVFDAIDSTDEGNSSRGLIVEPVDGLALAAVAGLGLGIQRRREED